MPDCWNYIGTNGNYRPHVYNGSYSPTANDNSLVMTAGTSSYGGSPNFAVMPLFDNLSGKILTFATAMENASYGHLTVGYVTDLTAASFVKLDTIVNNYYYYDNTRYVTHEVYVTNVPAGARIAFKWENTSSWYSCAIDDIAIVDMPACVQPIALTVDESTLTATSATLSWTDLNENTPEFGWVIKINTEDTTVTANPFTFDNLTPETEYIVKVMTVCTDSTYSEWSDSITFTTLPTCVAPSDVEVSAITTTSATISWTENNEATQWVINLNGTIDTTVTENPFTFDNLSASTAYTVKVKAICSDEDESDWSATTSFRTECGAVVVSEATPYHEGFESYNDFGCWTTEIISGSYDWAHHSTSAEGSYSAYLYYSAGSSRLISPVFDLTQLETPYLTFQHKQPRWSNDPASELYVYYRTSDIAEWTQLTSYTTYFEDFAEETFVLPEPSATYQLSFVGVGANGYSVYLDDVNITEAPSCLDPSAVSINYVTTTSATIAWTDNNTTAPQSWVIDLNGTEYEADTNPFTIETLTSATSYTVKVKAICNDDDESDWSAEASFETDCEAIAATGYSEDFSSYTGTTSYGTTSVMATCWSVIYSGDASGIRPYIHNGYYAANSYDNCLFINAGTNDDDDWDWDDVRAYGNTNYAVMPAMTDLNGTTMTYKYKYESSYYGSLTIGYVTDLDATSFQSIHDVAVSTTATMDTVTFANLPEGARIAFRWTNDYSYYGVAIDDINITGEPVVVDSCATPTNVAYENGVVTWTGDAANYNVHIVAGETTIDTTVNAATYTIEGLNEGDHATVTVQAICDEENLSEWSEAVEFDYTVGINSYAISANIFPNPTTGNVTVESNAIGADLTVFDMFGKLMMTSKVAAERTELNFSSFAPGVYMVRIANSNAITTIKVVKE